MACTTLGFSAGFGLYQAGEDVFWRVLAYLAVFHFVRQQWGWVAMYRGRLRERDPFGLWLDRLAIYLATIYREMGKSEDAERHVQRAKLLRLKVPQRRVARRGAPAPCS